MPKTSKTNYQRQPAKKDAATNSLWRKPIVLNTDETEDPLDALYKGREAAGNRSSVNAPIAETKGASSVKTPNGKPSRANRQTPAKKSANRSGDVSRKPTGDLQTTSSGSVSETPQIQKGIGAVSVDTKTALTTSDHASSSGDSTFDGATVMSVSELHTILRIPNDNFQFNDLREILRGKSFEMYVYLRRLSGEKGTCKIRHLELMKELDISRPTLFKQGEWLTKLGLIEKHSLPGDHLGTSYLVRRLEEVLPLPPSLTAQLDGLLSEVATRQE